MYIHQIVFFFFYEEANLLYWHVYSIYLQTYNNTSLRIMNVEMESRRRRHWLIPLLFFFKPLDSSSQQLGNK